MANIDECYQYIKIIDKRLEELTNMVNLLLVNNLLDDIKCNEDEVKHEQEQRKQEIQQYIKKISELEYNVSCRISEVKQFKKRISELESELNNIKNTNKNNVRKTEADSLGIIVVKTNYSFSSKMVFDLFLEKSNGVPVSKGEIIAKIKPLSYGGEIIMKANRNGRLFWLDNIYNNMTVNEDDILGIITDIDKSRTEAIGQIAENRKRKFWEK